MSWNWSSHKDHKAVEKEAFVASNIEKHCEQANSYNLISIIATKK